MKLPESVKLFIVEWSEFIYTGIVFILGFALGAVLL